MKKIIIIIAFAIIPFCANAQVGINTSTPHAMLDIKGSGYDPKGNSSDEKKATLRVDGTKDYSLDMGTQADSSKGSYIQSRFKGGSGLPLNLNSNGGDVGIGMIPKSNVNTSKSSKLYLNTASTAPSSGVATLVRDEATGEVMAVRVGNNARSFTNLTYEINNVEGDWLQDFDTKISASKYTVIITGLKFGGRIEAKGLRVGEGVPANSTYNPLNFNATPINGTWRLSADYDGGNPPSGINGNWTINVLVINNSLINTLPTETFDLNTSRTGTATSAPFGL
ncbi:MULTISPECIES: hypothetical protein [Chryseobacterium]|uniref:P/Homo B domain-containing protein n=1 Tax=Chryseobacterium geocarposphaerae TaxID=1416776 RepID=A0ABU1LBM3_9FLAO|nr:MULTISPECIES: hypothetical protein [Chryseobacterium]MDR6404127.1 hypothetical protein [Chryseobacterium geocarposphaerae]MDR6698354.1 hypothetical protein [Chryseobacterium ginsenosidimutans]